MKSFEKIFNYNKNGIIKKRHLFIIYENTDRYAGIDLDLLTEEARERVKDVLKDHEISNVPEKEITGYKKDWNKAWRVFLKSKIAN